MRKRKNIQLTFLVPAITALFASFIHAAEAQSVVAGAGGDYESISAALSDNLIGDGENESERDTIIVETGAYPAGSAMSQFVDVSSKSFVTIRARIPGEAVITLSTQMLFRWQYSSFVTIEGLKVTGGPAFGIFLFDTNFTIDNCSAENMQGYGIAFGGDVLKSAGAAGHSHKILDCVFSNNGSSTDGGHHGILIQNTSALSWNQRIVVDGCQLSGNGEDGIQTAGAIDNSHADEAHRASYIEIKNCVMNNNGENGIDIKAGCYVRAHHNTIIGNGAPGIVIHSPENTGLPGNTGSFKCAIHNNSIRYNSFHGIATGDGDYVLGTNNLIFNNLIIGNEGAGIFGDGSKNVSDYVFNNTIAKTAGNGTTHNYYGGCGISYPGTTSSMIAANNIVFGNAYPGFKYDSLFRKINNLLDDDEQNWTDNYYTANPEFVDYTADNYMLEDNAAARSFILSEDIMTAELVNEYKILLGEDMPVSEKGAVVDFADALSLYCPGAYWAIYAPEQAPPSVPTGLQVY